MEAVESTIAIRMVRPPSAGGFRRGVTAASAEGSSHPASEGRRVETEAEAANWKVLSHVMYPPDGPRAFAAMKRQQWKDVQNASKVQCFVKQVQFGGRVKKRIEAKREKAARVVQYYYKNRLQLGTGANMFANAIEQRRQEHREEEAANRALRRAEAERRLEAQMGKQQRRQQKADRTKALTRALYERAATDTIQRAVRRFFGTMAKRKLRNARAKFLRVFTGDGTGYALKMLIIFQRRVKLWLANNALFHAYYEDHRRFLDHDLTAPRFAPLEAELPALRRQVESDVAAAAEALRPCLSAPSQECALRLKLAEAHGELSALHGEDTPNATISPGAGPGAEERNRRGALAAASAVLDGMKGRLESDLRERCALKVQAARAEAAASQVETLIAKHAVLLPWLLGQSAVMREHSRLSEASGSAVDRSIKALSLEAKAASASLTRNNSNGPVYTCDDAGRRKRIQALEPKIASMKRELDGLIAASREYEELSAALGALKGAQHVLGIVEQLCGWRSWQHARGQRVVALTVLRGTRALAKRERTLAFDHAEAKARDQVLSEFGRFSSAPACKFTLRPFVKRKLINCDLKKLINSFKRHLAADVASGLGINLSRVHVEHTPEEKVASMKEADVGLSLMTREGACDFEITFTFEDGVEESDLPIELLKRAEHEIPNGSCDLSTIYAALGGTAAGGKVTIDEFDMRIVSRDAPTPMEVSVRNQLADKSKELRAASIACKEALAKARKDKLASCSTLAAGEPPPRTRAHKMAIRTALGAQYACDHLMSLMPERTPGDEHDLQFEWLPEVVRDARRETSLKLAKLDASLQEVEAAVGSRSSGKSQMLSVDGVMAKLRDQTLPSVHPPLEETGSIILPPLHAEFYLNKEMLAGRRSLAVSLAEHAATLDRASEAQIAALDASISTSPKARRSGSRSDSPSLGGSSKLALTPSKTLQRCKALMLLTQDPKATQQPMTPDSVLKMAHRLGIELSAGGVGADAEPEYYLLWIAVEALRAPLPPLWVRTADSRFEHSVTHESTDEHPMQPVFHEHVKHERARKKKRRPFASLERFMLFASDSRDVDGEGAFVFYNFATRQPLSGRKLPAEAVAEQVAKRPPPPPPKKKVERSTANSRNAKVEKKGKSTGVDEPPPPPPPLLRKPKPLSKDELAALRTQAAAVRRPALSLRPRSLPELMVAARMLGVDLVSQPNLVWLVDLCLACDYLPCGWQNVPPEEMMDIVPDDNEVGHGLVVSLASGDGAKVMRDVTWLPRLERIWHVATNGTAPPQYAHTMCSVTSERHPLQGFVRHVLGVGAE